VSTRWQPSTVAAGEPRTDVDWLINGAGAFEIGGPEGDTRLSGKALVAEAYRSAVPTVGGAFCRKDPRKVDPRGQALARLMSLDLVTSGGTQQATVWLVWRRGDERRHRIECDREPEASVRRRITIALTSLLRPSSFSIVGSW
jgi:S-adenosylmethionine synthetase